MNLVALHAEGAHTCENGSALVDWTKLWVGQTVGDMLFYTCFLNMPLLVFSGWCAGPFVARKTAAEHYVM